MGSLRQVKSEAIVQVFNDNIVWEREKYKGQHEFYWQEDGYPQVHGFIDLSAQDHFVELKCTSKPDYYTNPYWIHDQLGTYFLSNPNYEYCTIWAIRTPALKQTGNFKDEGLEDYKDRCIRDMIKRPSYYFTGYNRTPRHLELSFTEVNLI